MKATYNLVLSSTLLALLIVGSRITIPLPVIPLTLQTFMVFLIPLIAGRRRGIVIIFIYIVLGLVGLPVFSTGGGLTYIFTPSFGYLLGFIIAQPFIFYNLNKKRKSILNEALALLLIYLAGSIYMFLILKYYLARDISFIYVLSVGVLPFIAKDSLSIILSNIVAVRLRNSLGYSLEKAIS